MASEVKIKKWGNSLGVIIPKEVVEAQHLSENEKVHVFVVKEANLSALYGKLKGKLNLTGQQIKDYTRAHEN